MAGKKKEASLQVSVTNQEQWEEMLAVKGLTVVVYVYQQWCGPCRVVFSLLKKVYNELGDDLLHFATAEADSIDALERYRGKCEPTFLFYGGGELVGVLRGANAPLLQKMIVQKLSEEKMVLEKGGERKVVSQQMSTCTVTHTRPTLILCKCYTVAILKPDAVAHGKVNEIMMKIQNAGFQILAQEERTLTETEAADFYQHKAAEPCFEELVGFMSSGPSHILILSQAEDSANVVPAWREFIGPADTEEAKREMPERLVTRGGLRATSSLRAQYGTEALSNAVHGSENMEQASRELAFFFPNFRMASQTEQEGKEEHVERTLALIRPDVARESREKILSQIKESGFTVALQREVLLTEEQVTQFYSQHLEEDCFPALLHAMTSGPVLALALARKEAVCHWRNMLGPSDVNKAKEEDPESLRAQFAVGSASINQLHGSASHEEAEREIRFFFPPQQTLAAIKPDAMQEHKETILEEIRGSGFSILQKKEMVLTKEMAEELYKEHREKPYFSQVVEFMSSGPCMVLILNKENAVEEWRAMMGPTDPEQAKATCPTSMRARFASDILHNSLHGASSEEHAREEIRFIFGDPPAN
uniref:Nucleoside diphosphate kinase B n=1 Tax=Tetraodon nigroviridis TaxID=99883 RepID=H3DGC3_TETNG